MTLTADLRHAFTAVPVRQPNQVALDEDEDDELADLSALGFAAGGESAADS
jgi:hypothetical protein